MLSILNRNDKGIEDYFPRDGYTKKQVSDFIKQTFSLFENELDNVLSKKNEIDIGKLYHVVEHTGYHLGQIVDRTKLITHAAFEFCQTGINEKNLRHTIFVKLK